MERVDTNLDKFYSILLQVDHELYIDIFENTDKITNYSKFNENDENQADKWDIILYALNKLWNLHKLRIFPKIDLKNGIKPNHSINIVNSIEDLASGVVLATLITSFCPWLEDLASKMFPQNYEFLTFENKAHNSNIFLQLLSAAGLTNRLEFDSIDMLGNEKNNYTFNTFFSFSTTFYNFILAIFMGKPYKKFLVRFKGFG